MAEQGQDNPPGTCVLQPSSGLTMERRPLYHLYSFLIVKTPGVWPNLILEKTGHLDVWQPIERTIKPCISYSTVTVISGQKLALQSQQLRRDY